jgi:hypothetical protein
LFPLQFRKSYIYQLSIVNRICVFYNFLYLLLLLLFIIIIIIYYYYYYLLLLLTVIQRKQIYHITYIITLQCCRSGLNSYLCIKGVMKAFVARGVTLGPCIVEKIFFINNEEIIPHSNLISSSNRGGLSYPSSDVITCALYVYSVTNKLLEFEKEFVKEPNQRNTIMEISRISLLEVYLFLDHNCNEHSKSSLITKILSTLANILLNNYSKKRNNLLNSKTMPQLKRSKPGNPKK